MDFNYDLPDTIFNVVMQEDEQIEEFLSDDDNIIFIVEYEDETKIVGLSKEFYPFQDDAIVINCKTHNLGLIYNSYKKKTKYVNFEKIGVLFDRNEAGILVELDEINELIKRGCKIIKLENKSNEIVTSLVTLAFLLKPQEHGAVSALHCQGGYFGKIFKPIDLRDYGSICGINLNYDNFDKFPNKNMGEKYHPLVKKLLKTPSKYLYLEEDEYECLKKIKYTNPLYYPKEYYDIYEREKKMRNLNNYENLINITNYKIESETKMENENIIKNKKNYYNNQKLENTRIFLNNILGIYNENIVIAGGFALSYFLEKNNIYTRNNDIDLFLYGSDLDDKIELQATIINIINLIINYHDKTKIINGNGEIFDEDKERPFSKVTQTEHSINILIDKNKINGETTKIQIIKRLYKSPSEIIHGFDIDSSCILMNLSGVIYTTERGKYSMDNKCNIVNFDRLSPSYESRLVKYFERGFSIYVPFLNILKKYMPINKEQFEKPLMFSYKIINFLLNETIIHISDYENEWEGNVIVEKYSEINYNFKKLNPNEQTVNTFNRIFLKENNLKNWYPTKIKIKNCHFPFVDNKIFKISEKYNEKDDSLLECTNIYRKKNIKDKKYLYENFAENFLKSNNFSSIYLSGLYAFNIYNNTSYPSRIEIHLKQTENRMEIIHKIFSNYSNFIYYNYLPKMPKILEKSTIYSPFDYNNFIIGPRILYIDEGMAPFYETEWTDYEISNSIPTLRIYKEKMTKEEILNSKNFDFEKIIYDLDKDKFYSNELGKYAVENRVHISSVIKYEDLLYTKYKSFGFLVDREEIIENIFS